VGAGVVGGGMRDIAYGHRPQRDVIASDRVPVGEVEVRRGDPVHASDGFIGSVAGLIVDPADPQVTHVLLAEGHLWGRKQVAIPIGAMTRRDQEIRVDLTREQIEALPPVNRAVGLCGRRRRRHRPHHDHRSVRIRSTSVHRPGAVSRRRRCLGARADGRRRS
jgi:hypothetical protein